MSAKVVNFPADRSAAHRIDFVDPGPAEDLMRAVSGRVPPHNLDSEVSVLSAVMSRSEIESLRLEAVAKDRASLVETWDRSLAALDATLAMLGPQMFYSEANGRIWQAFEQLRAAGTPIDRSTVIAWLARSEMLAKVGGERYVKQIAHETPAAGNVEAHAKTVRELWEKREHIAAHQREAVELYGDVGEWEERKAESRTTWSKLTAPRQKLVGAPIGVAVQEARARIEVQPQGGIRGVSWGLRPLDQAFGPLAQSEQHIIGGLSEHGKTALAGQIAESVAATPLDIFGVGEAVYVLSGEMKAHQFVLRLACSLAGLDASRVKAGVLEPAESEALGQWMGWLERLPIVVDDEPADAETMARRIAQHQHLFATGYARRAPKRGEPEGALHSKCRLRTVIADHVQKLARVCSGLGPRADMKERIAAVSHGWLTHIAKGLDVATILLAQVRRDAVDGGRGQKGKIAFPRSAHLEGASELAQDADTIALVHQPQLPMLEADEEVPARWQDVAAIIPGKRRWGGARGLVRLGYKLGKFSEELPPGARGEPHYGS